ncbi:MAG: acetyl-CoA carboxylase, carboxyltransferase subunit beta [Nitrospinaceae bacterium]|jgi:acetyl-CoA carboxylase carboxyl transferase subunit beta|nr:acetyl-CoA carboxylase, carboxyltransferase subunit beta [Nitrospinaceae bacterium]
MSWIDKIKSKTGLGKKASEPEEIWIECKGCKGQIYVAELDENLRVCPQCDHHFRIEAKHRVMHLLEPGTFVEHDKDLSPTDPLKFKDSKKYKDRLRIANKKGMTSDAVIAGSGVLANHSIELCFFEFKFMGGSMGVVVGEKITRTIERAIKNHSALIIISCSGGARMQEGILSLMQMAKTSAALNKLSREGLPYISILTDPTTGGVSASFAMLGDIILAEPGALIGFAGPRVIEQTIRQKLPDGFQRAEFLLDHGLIDQVVHRKDLKSTLNQILSLLSNTPVASSANKAE